jgi:hypothetical protein
MFPDHLCRRLQVSQVRTSIGKTGCADSNENDFCIAYSKSGIVDKSYVLLCKAKKFLETWLVNGKDTSLQQSYLSLVYIEASNLMSQKSQAGCSAKTDITRSDRAYFHSAAITFSG